MDERVLTDAEWDVELTRAMNVIRRAAPGGRERRREGRALPWVL